jgi:hypothetical protein
MTLIKVKKFLGKKTNSGDKGVTMVEFALILPVFMMFTLGLIDLSRIYALKAILNKGAEEGLNLALKIPNLDVDIETLASNDIEYGRYMQARSIVIAKASSLPLSTLFSDGNTPGMAQITNYVYRDPDILGPDIINSAPAGLIRPGDRLELNSQGSGKWITHKTLPSTGSVPPQPPEVLYRSHPIIVELRATVRPLTPFLGPLNISSRAMGYREEIPRGPLNASYGLLDPADDPNFVGGGPGAVTTTTLQPADDGRMSCNPCWFNCIRLNFNRDCAVLNGPPNPTGCCPCFECNTQSNPRNEFSMQ